MTRAQDWCILRTSGPRTLRLAESLAAAGFDVWTPKRTFQRVLSKGHKTERRVERDAPILPTVVFASAVHLDALSALAANFASRHSDFSIFTHAGRAPLVGNCDVRGLQEAEAVAAVAIQRQRDADTREEAEAIRIATIKTEQARRRAMKMAERERRLALRSERRDFEPGVLVDVADEPALVGVIGTVIKGQGHTALIDFGGSLVMKVEAWRLTRHAVQGHAFAA